MLSIPDAVRAKAAILHAEGWLAELPSVVRRLERDWSLTVGSTYPDGTEAYVAEATLANGTPVVLKVPLPPADRHRHEITVLQLADGDGCVQLLRHDEASGALLLERLGSPMSEFGLPLPQRLALLSDAARRIWRPAPECGLPTGVDKGRWLMEFVPRTWDSTDRPCREQTVAHALACAEARVAAHDDERAVLLHGDVHQWNALRSGSVFKLVDPDGLVAEAEYDLGILMREDPLELMTGDPWDRARWLAARTGTDETAIWEWGVVERVATGLLCAAIDLQPVGCQMLAAADRIALS